MGEPEHVKCHRNRNFYLARIEKSYTKEVFEAETFRNIPMIDRNVLLDYSESIKRFREQCLNSGMSEEEFKNVYHESLQSLFNQQDQETSNNITSKIKYIFILFLTIILSCICGYYYKNIYSSIVCELQELIYPGLRLLRKLAIPFLSLFPSLTDLYHETCLIQNPFFTVVDMDCWPCSSVNNVREVFNPVVSSTQHNAPFIYETNQQVINLDGLRDIFNANKNTFDKESLKIRVDNKHYITPTEMFASNQIEENNFYVWKFNNMHSARILRQYISRPKVVPKFGQSTERFIIIDSSQNIFKVPDTECNYSFLLSLSGSRIIKLVPAEECKYQCKSLKVELKEKYLLWYNWWYWRPVVHPSNSNDTFIGHVGSYC